MMLTVLAPHRVQTKRRRRAIDGNSTASSRSSAAKMNGTECWHAAFATFEAVAFEMRDGG